MINWIIQSNKINKKSIYNIDDIKNCSELPDSVLSDLFDVNKIKNFFTNDAFLALNEKLTQRKKLGYSCNFCFKKYENSEIGVK